MLKSQISDNNPVLLKGQEDLDLVFEEDLNSKVIISDFLGKTINLEIKNNTTVNVLYFTRTKEETTINILVNENVHLTFDAILLNGDTKDLLNVRVLGSFSDVNINTLSIAKEATKHIDFNVIHEAKASNSQVTNYGISFEKGANMYNVVGKILPNMTGSDVRQITRGLILSPTGVCEVLPVLLIDHHDVKAYHGATIGKINDEDLFYLMSRGLSKDEAFMLIINGLLEPFVKNIFDEEIKNTVLKAYQGYFEGE